jgi:hypothetical protein
MSKTSTKIKAVKTTTTTNKPAKVTKPEMTEAQLIEAIAIEQDLAKKRELVGKLSKLVKAPTKSEVKERAKARKETLSSVNREDCLKLNEIKEAIGKNVEFVKLSPLKDDSELIASWGFPHVGEVARILANCKSQLEFGKQDEEIKKQFLAEAGKKLKSVKKAIFTLQKQLQSREGFEASRFSQSIGKNRVTFTSSVSKVSTK